MSTNRVKWDDSARRFTAYCDDDSGETEIGPAKWDDANNRFEINCNGTDFPVKWNDTTKVFEAQGVDAACCGLWNPCEQCNRVGAGCQADCGPECYEVEIDVWDLGSIVRTCTGYVRHIENCCWEGQVNEGGPDYKTILHYSSNHSTWSFHSEANLGGIDDSCNPTLIANWTYPCIYLNTFSCDAGGRIWTVGLAAPGDPCDLTAAKAFGMDAVFTPDEDCSSDYS